MCKTAFKETVAAAIKGAAAPKWLQDVEITRTDITTFLLNAHGGEHPITGEYVTPGKRSNKWDDNPPVHNKNIYYEGIGSRQINKLIEQYLDYLKMPCIIVNDTYEDTPIHVKRKMVGEFSSGIRDRCLVLEVHSNATKEMRGKANGSEFFTGIGHTFSDVFVHILGVQYDKEFPNQKHRRFRANEEKEARFGVFKIDEYFSIPTVLAEFFFMDNKKECMELLMTEEGRARIAKVCVLAIVEFINLHF